jgi:CheY-like chemotaxis protein
MGDNIALVVDDTPANRDFLSRLIMQTRLNVRSAGDGKSALEAVSDLQNLKLAVVDMKLPDMDGLQLTVALRTRFPDAYIIIATMYDDTSLMELVIDQFGVRPFQVMARTG